MKNKRRIYSLENLTEEEVAVCFAKCSRTPDSFEVIAKELTEEKSSRFHEKWVVGYGHSSVAEHAVVRLAIENVSLLSVEWIQDNRLVSFTEKSSRYQIYDKEHYFVPTEIKKDKKMLKLYRQAVESLLDTYEAMIEPLTEFVSKREGEDLPVSKLRGMVMDQARFLLPAAMLTNLGMTANTRSWEYAISKWLSSGVDEVVEIAKEAKAKIKKICPTLVKYADKNEYLADIYNKSKNLVKGVSKEKVCNRPVRVVDWDRGAMDKVVATMLYGGGSGDYKQALSWVKKKDKKWKLAFLKKRLKERSEHDHLPREFESVFISFDVLSDQGAYYDFKRNRMMTQIRQDLTIENGYMVPKMIKDVGMERVYMEAIEKMEEIYRVIKKQYPKSAQYLVTKAHNRRYLLKMNLRELFYFVRLRARKAGNFAYRRMAMIMLEETKKKYPELMKLFFEEKELDSRKKIEKEYFWKFK
ncbi:hypothetical protein DRH14_02255 [Candidatus Shapirobacteria bacterium]|nr:MAG: hypothetical protein DRH14_02255 [Candidatus Shapirobacteria bacterium]